MHQREIITLITQLNRKFDHMALDLTRLIKDISDLKTTDASILALITAFVAQIKDLSAQLAAAIAANDPAAQAAVQAQLDALAADVEGETAALSKAVVENTPAA
jgi:ABC-type transporter Mla subunit MlaD